MHNQLHTPYVTTMHAVDGNGAIFMAQRHECALTLQQRYGGASATDPKNWACMRSLVDAFVGELIANDLWDDDTLAVVRVIGGDPTANGYVSEVSFGADTGGVFVYRTSVTDMEEALYCLATNCDASGWQARE